MSVLIKGMKMPKNCTICRFCAPEADPGDGEMCMATGRFMPPCSTERLEECPLVEVPTPHGRLIDADELEDKLNAWTQENFSFSDRYQFNLEGMIRASDFAMALPTIIEAEEGEDE